MCWLRDLTYHVEQVNAVLMKDYRLKRALLDCLWSFVGNKSENKSYPKSDESSTFWISTILDTGSRLRAARGIGKDETKARQKAFQVLQQRDHPDGPLSLVCTWIRYGKRLYTDRFVCCPMSRFTIYPNELHDSSRTILFTYARKLDKRLQPIVCRP